MNFNTVFDEFIHDWPLPNTLISESFMVMGCSHTVGVGVNKEDSYPMQLSKHYGIPVYNLAISNGNIDVCRLNFYKLIESQIFGKFNFPKFLVMQWPNPIRKIIWKSKQHELVGSLENINNGSTEFQQLIPIHEMQFYFDWMMAIRDINATCKALKLPVINIYLNQLNSQYRTILYERDITIHWDEKLPGKTWLFDSAASDNIHHSAWCHNQWTKRLIPLIDEATTR